MSATFPVIGIVGGVASGKSFVAQKFAELGACAVDGDQLGHQVLTQSEVIETLASQFGQQILRADGTIDRSQVAKLVFADTEDGAERLASLERLTHPLIGQAMNDRIQALESSERCRAAVIDAAVMVKAGWDKHCDHIVFVDVPEAERVRRASKRGWSEQELRRREAMQVDLERKMQRADFVIDNGGSPERTCQQVKDIWNSIF